MIKLKLVRFERNWVVTHEDGAHLQSFSYDIWGINSQLAARLWRDAYYYGFEHGKDVQNHEN